jgi:hypothetical protein
MKGIYDYITRHCIKTATQNVPAANSGQCKEWEVQSAVNVMMTERPIINVQYSYTEIVKTEINKNWKYNVMLR